MNKPETENKPISSSQISKDSISTKLLLPMAIVFLAVSLSCSLVISSLIFSRSIAGNKIEVSSSTSATTNPTADPYNYNNAVTNDQLKAIFTGDYIKFGDGNRKVLFVEFSDPSCPYCHAAGGDNTEIYKSLGDNFKLTSAGGTYTAPVPEMRKLVNEGKASFAWIYYPGHGNGEMGAQALFCANEKGKFWEVHDLLMSDAGYNILNNVVKNDKTKSQELTDFIKTAIDPSFVKSCIDSGKYVSRLASDTKLAADLKLTTAAQWGTPGFLVNKWLIPGADDYKNMKSNIDAALQG